MSCKLVPLVIQACLIRASEFNAGPVNECHHTHMYTAGAICQTATLLRTAGITARAPQRADVKHPQETQDSGTYTIIETPVTELLSTLRHHYIQVLYCL